MANATSTAGAAAQVAARALRARNNENAPKFFAAGIGGIIVLYMIFHWSRCLYKRQRTGKGQASKILRIPVAISRLASRILLLKAPGFVSTGHSVVFVAYVAINLAVIFTNIDWTNLVGLSKRLGWMTVGNLAFVFVLSLKHTPLAFLISFSYERLQPLHQVAGYSTIACLFCHAIIYITAWKRSNTLHDLTENENIMGIVAGFCFLIILVLTFLRRRNYELFHLTHILLAMLVLIFSGLHRPELLTYQHSTYALIFAACIWVLDVLVRSTKLAIYRLGNGASLTPLPHGGTRIVLRKTILGATPGKHVFLHLPKIRAMELHPFTLNSVDPVEMVAVACDGFTKDLHDYAIANPEAEIAASIDGPYGSLPDFAGVGKVLFIAGGSGASFTTGVALELLKEQKSVVRKVEFVWVVRHTDQISWFAPHLLSLASDPRVSLRVHVTHHHFADTASDSVASLSAPDSITSPTTREPEKDPEKSLPMQSGSLSSEGPYTAIPGRPDVTKVVRDSVAEAGEIGEGERVMVVACGPEAMMLEVRMAVAGSLRGSGPAVEMHLESFCW